MQLYPSVAFVHISHPLLISAHGMWLLLLPNLVACGFTMHKEGEEVCANAIHVLHYITAKPGHYPLQDHWPTAQWQGGPH